MGVTSFVKLLSSYLEHFFPRPASKRSGLALANPWSTPGAADAERAAVIAYLKTLWVEEGKKAAPGAAE